MKPTQIRDTAISIVSDFTDHWPSSIPAMNMRMSQRQQQLFVKAGGWDREYYGICATVTLNSDGKANLTDLEDENVFEMERIDYVVVRELASGTPSDAAVEVGDRINLIPVYDAENHLAPRMTLRSHQLEAYGTDLEHVTKVEVFYSRRPKTIKPTGLVGTNTEEEDVELESPWDDLLVWDLVRDLVRRTIKMETEARAAVYELIDDVETKLLEDFENHDRGFAHGRQDRFVN